MTPKRQKFVEAMMVERSATRAAQVAGYSQPAQEAGRLLKNEQIQAALAERRASLAERVTENVSLGREDVLSGLYAEATFHGEGASHSARVQAWRGIAALLHLEQPQEGAKHLHVNLPEMTVEDMRRLLSGGRVDGLQRLQRSRSGKPRSDCETF